MSTVCMLGHPAPGHINPTLPVIAELVRRGERVHYFATSPFRARVEATGAAFHAYGEHALFERNLGTGGMLGGMAGLMDTTEALLPALLERVRAAAPDVLLVEAHAVWGNLIAQVLGLPTVTLCSMFAISDTLLPPSALLQHLYGRAPREQALEGLIGFSRYCETAKRVRRRFGAAAPDLIDYLGNRQPLNIVLTSRAFQVGGEAFDDRYAFVGPAVSDVTTGALETTAALPDLDACAAAGQPLIYVSMGTMYNDEAALYRVCFDAFGGAAFGGRSCQVIMAVGHRIDAARLPEPPPNVHVREYVPQLAVLRRADLFITHGGINSAHEAMLCGVPMIVLPAAADHFIVAERVGAVGAGVVLDRREATAARLAELSERVLADAGYRARSAAMGASLREAGGAGRAADEILRYVAARSN